MPNVCHYQREELGLGEGRPGQAPESSKKEQIGHSKTEIMTSDTSWRSEAPTDDSLDEDQLDMTSFFLDESSESAKVDDGPVPKNPGSSDLLLGLEELGSDEDLAEFSESLNKLNVIKSSGNDLDTADTSELDTSSGIDDFFGNELTRMPFLTGKPVENVLRKDTENIKGASGSDEIVEKKAQSSSLPIVSGQSNKQHLQLDNDDEITPAEVLPPSKKAIPKEKKDQPAQVHAANTKIGDSVLVIKGPFKDFEGKVISKGEGKSFNVELDVFGRPTVVDISDIALKTK